MWWKKSKGNEQALAGAPSAAIGTRYNVCLAVLKPAV